MSYKSHKLVHLSRGWRDTRETSVRIISGGRKDSDRHLHK